MNGFRRGQVILLSCILLLSAVVMTACQNEKRHPIATVTMQNGVVIRMNLFEDVSPQTVANFITLANQGYYDGKTLFAVKSDMIAMGAMSSSANDSPGYTIEGEFLENGVNNNIDLSAGSVVSYRASGEGYDQGGYAFAILTDKNVAYLKRRNAPMGQVFDDDLALLPKLRDVDKDFNDKPKKDVKIKSIRVNLNGWKMVKFKKLPLD